MTDSLKHFEDSRARFAGLRQEEKTIGGKLSSAIADGDSTAIIELQNRKKKLPVELYAAELGAVRAEMAFLKEQQAELLIERNKPERLEQRFAAEKNLQEAQRIWDDLIDENTAHYHAARDLVSRTGTLKLRLEQLLNTRI